MSLQYLPQLFFKKIKVFIFHTYRPRFGLITFVILATLILLSFQEKGVYEKFNVYTMQFPYAPFLQNEIRSKY